jgi:hypothetical protein
MVEDSCCARSCDGDGDGDGLGDDDGETALDEGAGVGEWLAAAERLVEACVPAAPALPLPL